MQANHLHNIWSEKYLFLVWLKSLINPLNDRTLTFMLGAPLIQRRNTQNTIPQPHHTTLPCPFSYKTQLNTRWYCVLNVIDKKCGTGVNCLPPHQYKNNNKNSCHTSKTLKENRWEKKNLRPPAEAAVPRGASGHVRSMWVCLGAWSPSLPALWAPRGHWAWWWARWCCRYSGPCGANPRGETGEPCNTRDVGCKSHTTAPRQKSLSSWAKQQNVIQKICHLIVCKCSYSAKQFLLSLVGHSSRHPSWDLLVKYVATTWHQINQSLCFDWYNVHSIYADTQVKCT